jgi:dihydroxyacetone kinase-like protein
MKTAGKMELSAEDWLAVLQGALDGVIMRGKAEVGDKTMVDALTPAVEAFRNATNEKQSMSAALATSAEAARKGMESTIPIVARKGRASYLGERSADHQDPGATSTYLLLKTAAEIWSNNS